MRSIWVLGVVGWLAVSAGAVPVPNKPVNDDGEKIDPMKQPRLPLWIQAGGQFSPLGRDLLPAVHVGRMNPLFGFKPLPIQDDRIACWHDTRILLKKEDLLVQLARGQQKLLPATQNHATTLLLVGPSGNGGESFGPSRLTRVGDIFTLVVESWTHNGVFRRNIPHQALYVVHLGNLNAGKYDLHIHWNELHCDRALGALHQLTRCKKGIMKFQVHKDATADDASVIQLADLQKSDLPADAKKRFWQRPLYWQRELGAGGNLDAIPAAGLRVGSFDVANWLARNPTNLGDVPGLQFPPKNQPSYAVVLGPPLDTGMWLTPESIEWQEKKILLRVDVWRDNERRLQNLKHHSLLVVPLANTFGLVKPGDYRVEVEWTWLRAPTNREPYTREKVPEDMKFLLDRSGHDLSIR